MRYCRVLISLLMALGTSAFAADLYQMPTVYVSATRIPRELAALGRRVVVLDSALNLNPHFHVLMLDGVYAGRDEETAPVLVPAPQFGVGDPPREGEEDVPWRRSVADTDHGPAGTSRRYAPTESTTIFSAG